jgi:hypothetical protein
MSTDKVMALKSLILKVANYDELPEQISEQDIVTFFKRHSMTLSCSSLRAWLNGTEEPSDEILLELMEENKWRAGGIWSKHNP